MLNDRERTASKDGIRWDTFLSNYAVLSIDIVKSRDLAQRFHSIGIHLLKGFDISNNICQFFAKSGFFLRRERQSGQFCQMSDLVERELCHTMRIA